MARDKAVHKSPLPDKLRLEIISSGSGNLLAKRCTLGNAFVYDGFSARPLSCSIILTMSGKDFACIFSIARLR